MLYGIRVARCFQNPYNTLLEVLMNQKPKLFIYFSVAGLIAGSLGWLFLFSMYSPESRQYMFGIKHQSIYLALPVIASLVSGITATLLNSPNFGAKQGILTALLAFLIYNIIVAIIGQTGFAGFFAFTFFGGIILGWVLLLIGGITGWLLNHSNKTL